MYTGNRIPGPVSNAWSGVSVIPDAEAATTTRLTWAASPGPAAVEETGAPVIASRGTPAGSVTVVTGEAGGVESHISGAAALKTVRPLASAAARFPAGSAETVTPVAAVASASERSEGFAAAEASCTASTS